MVMIVIAVALVLNVYISVFVNNCDPRDWAVSVFIWTVGSSATHLVIGAVAGLLWSFIISYKRRRAKKRAVRQHAIRIYEDGKQWFSREILEG